MPQGSRYHRSFNAIWVSIALIRLPFERSHGMARNSFTNEWIVPTKCGCRKRRWPALVELRRSPISVRAAFVWDSTQMPCRLDFQRLARIASFATRRVVLPLPGHASMSSVSRDRITASLGSAPSSPANALSGKRMTAHAHFDLLIGDGSQHLLQLVRHRFPHPQPSKIASGQLRPRKPSTCALLPAAWSNGSVT